jgi:hypothetical protein
VSGWLVLLDEGTATNALKAKDGLVEKLWMQYRWRSSGVWVFGIVSWMVVPFRPEPHDCGLGRALR